jgi:hypothetical protein
MIAMKVRAMKRSIVTITAAVIMLSGCAVMDRHAYDADDVALVNVRACGAVADTLVNDQAAFQTAVDICIDRGGGTVYVPPGDYRIGPVVLGDNVTLHLEAGATLFASRDAALYDNPRARPGGGRPALIFAHGCRNIAITGKGTIDGQAQHVWAAQDSTSMFIKWETENAKAAGIPLTRAYHVAPKYYLVNIEDCEDVRIEDVSLVNSQWWTLSLMWCERVFIRGVHVRSDLELGVNADGIDIDGCRDVVVSDCVVITGDDAICLKAGRRDGRVENCENITVTNCVTTSTSSALKIGTESWGDFRNIIFSNCTVNNTNRALGIYARYGGTVENVIFSNIVVQCDRKHYNWWGDGELLSFVILREREDIPLATVRNILVENVIAHVQGTSVIRGFDGFGTSRSIEGVTLRNITMHVHPEDTLDKRADHAFDIELVDGCIIEDVNVIWDDETEPLWKSALSIRDAENVRIRGFQARQAHRGDEDNPAVLLDNVRHVDMRDCISAGDTYTFLQVEGEGSRDVFVTGNNLERSVRPVYIRSEVDPDEVVTENNRSQP